MDRMACVDIPLLSLQLLLRQQPAWRQQPTAVVESDKPQGQILFVNKVAREGGIRPGMRYASGLALSRELRAGVISTAEVGKCVETLTEELQRFSPNVEPSDHAPGIFWLDAEVCQPEND